MSRSNCQIRVDCNTAKRIKNASITHDSDGKSTESYDSIIRRAIKCLGGATHER